MSILIELLMYVFVIIGMMTVMICIFEKQIFGLLSKEYIEKDNIVEKDENNKEPT